MIDAAPPIWLPPKPAIIHRLPIVKVRYGTDLSGKMEYAEHHWPRDIIDASLAEALVYMPGQFDPLLPKWALAKMLPNKSSLAMAAFIGVLGGGLTKTVEFITTTSASNQTYNVAADFNVSDNYIGVVSHAGNSSSALINTRGGGGGGGGGFADKSNLSLTPGGTTTYRLRAANAGTTDGAACWFGGTSLAGSSVGIRGGSQAASTANGAAGASITNAVGDNKRPGGAGGQASTGTGNRGGGGGGGAAGPDGDGGNGGNGNTSAGGNPGTANGGQVTGNGTNGNEWNDGTNSRGPGTGGRGGLLGDGDDAGEYGAAAGGGGSTSGNDGNGGTAAGGLIVVINNASA